MGSIHVSDVYSAKKKELSPKVACSKRPATARDFIFDPGLSNQRNMTTTLAL